MKFDEWAAFIREQKTQPYFNALSKLIETSRLHELILPPAKLVLDSFRKTPLEKIKVVIVGTEPYPDRRLCDGIAFSSKDKDIIPNTLRNIYKEYSADLGFAPPSSGDLNQWCSAGVMLLNTVLTVRENSPHSNHNCGWESFTREAIKYISNHLEGVVFIFWGDVAKENLSSSVRKDSKHYVIESPHPAELSAYTGFFGSKPFSRANSYLHSIGKPEVDWKLIN
jgi:uracil-DNA glycosylase